MEILLMLFALWWLWSCVSGRGSATDEPPPEPEVRGHASIRKGWW
jgi:hypothetical protein